MKKSHIVYAVLVIVIAVVVVGYVINQLLPSETKQWMPIVKWEKAASGGVPYDFMTETFEIINGTKWLVSWKVDASNYANYSISVKVYDASTNSIVQEISSDYIANSSSHFTTKGMFYLRIVLSNSSPINRWEVAVWEYRSGPWIQ